MTHAKRKDIILLYLLKNISLLQIVRKQLGLKSVRNILDFPISCFVYLFEEAGDCESDRSEGVKARGKVLRTPRVPLVRAGPPFQRAPASQ